MAGRTLIEKIEGLLPESRAKVERYVDSLPNSSGPLFSRELLDQIKQDYEALAREHGFIETDPILRDFRENGGR